MPDFLSVENIPQVVAAITQAAEDHNRALSSLLRTRNKFEGWWQGTLVAGLAGPPWLRTPGGNTIEGTDDGAELSIECTTRVADRRLRYSRRTGSGVKRIDLAVKAGRLDSRAHLLELKLLDGRWPLTDQLPGIEKDAHALRAMKAHGDIASGWLLVLAYKFGTTARARDALVTVGKDRIGAPVVAPLKVEVEDPACIVGLRFA